MMDQALWVFATQWPLFVITAIVGVLALYWIGDPDSNGDVLFGTLVAIFGILAAIPAGFAVMLSPTLTFGIISAGLFVAYAWLWLRWWENHRA